jgi:hypothetical protein
MSLSTQNAKIGLYTVVATLGETEPMPANPTMLYLGLQQTGTIETLDDWHQLLDVGRRIGVWTTGPESVKLTDLGREYASEINSTL